ncbi:hypothetical protein AB1286_20100 [Trinickia sp. NRRL B-1857]|uniref:hypothetical protein n=1 Tax=Trinickia sp. NRRL B-1857 TaxID=3162879 RepID=UPI003D2E1A47
MTVLNPNHPVMRATEDLWRKLAAILLLRSGDDEVVITSADVQRLAGLFPGDEPTIVVCDKPDGLHLSIVPRAHAEVMARAAGGLPQ